MTRAPMFLAGAVVGTIVTMLTFAMLSGRGSLDRNAPVQTQTGNGALEVVARPTPAESTVAAARERRPTEELTKEQQALNATTRAVPFPSKPTEAREQNREWRSLVDGTIEDALKPDRSAEWDALVSGMLEYEVERRFGRRLELVQQQRLLDKLAQVRYASLGLQQEFGDPGSPAALRTRLSRTLAMLQADRVFREELGIGIAQFLQGLDGDAVEDVAPPRTRR